MELLQSYMLTTDNIASIKATRLNFKNNVPVFVKTIKKNITYFKPKYEDSLFWCFYIIHNGFDEYELVGNSYFITEKNFKIKTIELLRDKKSLLKQYKLKRNDIEDQLINCKYINISGFYALCIYYNINFMYINGPTSFEYLNNDETPVYVIHKIDNKYYYEINANVGNYRETYYKIENLCKPIKGISGYKVSELQEIATKLMIGEYEYTNKQKLYELIINKIDNIK